MIPDAPDFPSALNKAIEIVTGIKSSYESFRPANFQVATTVIATALNLIVVSKNHKYGKANINEFGEHGIFIRLWDKIQRLKNHIFNGKDVGIESSLDTWGDIAGYGVVGVLKKLGWYDLPIDET